MTLGGSTIELELLVVVSVMPVLGFARRPLLAEGSIGLTNAAALEDVTLEDVTLEDVGDVVEEVVIVVADRVEEELSGVVEEEDEEGIDELVC